MLVLSRKLNESIMINGLIEIKLIDIGASNIRIGIDAPMEYHILRKEVHDLIQEENKQASSSDILSTIQQLKVNKQDKE